MRNHLTKRSVVISIGFQHYMLPYNIVAFMVVSIVMFILPLLLVEYVQEFVQVFFSREISHTLATILLYALIGIVNNKLSMIWGITTVNVPAID